MTFSELSADGDLHLIARQHAENLAQAWSEKSLREMLKTPGTIGFAASEGFILFRVAAEEAEVLTLAVTARARRSGLGSVLLREAARRAHAQGARAMFLEVSASNGAALALYGKHGFRSVGIRKSYYGPSDDALVLRAELPFAPFGNSSASTRI